MYPVRLLHEAAPDMIIPGWEAGLFRLRFLLIVNGLYYLSASTLGACFSSSKEMIPDTAMIPAAIAIVIPPDIL